jgi:hypothetical protein
MKDVGAISPGMKANIVLLDADPTVDVANTKKISAVIMRGTLYSRGQLNELLNEAAGCCISSGPMNPVQRSKSRTPHAPASVSIIVLHKY